MKRATLIALLAVAAFGCNPDNTPSNDRTDTGVPDAFETDTTPDAGGDAGGGGDATDAAPDASSDAAADTPMDTPEAGVPELLVVSVSPSRGVYPVGVVITPTGTVYDQTAEVLAGLPINWTVTPENAVTAVGDGFRLERETAVTFRGCTPLDDSGGLNLCGEKRVEVDSGSPTLEIFTPEPGAELVASEHEMINVTGRATDSHGTVRAFVNGRRATLDAEGNFSVDVRPIYGVNHIDVVASDGLNGRATERGVDVMWAHAYHPVASDPVDGTISGQYPQSLLLRMNQRYLDADEPVSISEDGILTADDIAGLLEFVIGEVDLMSFIEGSNPISDSESFALTIDNATLGPTVLDIRVTADGLELFVSMPEVRLETIGAITITDTPLSLNGGIRLAVSALIDVAIEKETAEDDLVVEPRSIVLALEDAVGEFESEEVNAIIELAEGLLFSVVEDLALSAIEESFLTDLPVILGDALGSIEEGLTGAEFPLDLGFGGDPVVITVDARLDSLVPEARTSLMVDFGLNVGTSVAPSFPTTRGIAMNVPFDRAAPLFVSSRAQVAVRVPLMNGILHSLWNSGLLEIDAAELIPPELAFVIEGAVISGLLPPHLTPTRPDAAEYGFIMTIGQMEMELYRLDRRDRVGINLQVGANIEVIDNALVVSIQAEPTLTMWMIEQLGPDPVFEDISALQSLFEGAIWPLLTEQLEEGLVIDLPAIDLASVGDLAPRLNDLTMDLVLDNPIEIREGYFVLDGAFTGTADLRD